MQKLTRNLVSTVLALLLAAPALAQRPSNTIDAYANLLAGCTRTHRWVAENRT